MVWSDVSPNGSISVNANTSSMQANTAYIETTMKRDHYWNEGTDKDGHHKQIQITKQDSDANLDTGMNGVMYIKEASASNTRVEGFYRNADGIYQFIPSFKKGTVSISSTTDYSNLTSVPANCYGNVSIFTTVDPNDMTYAFFVSNGTTVNAYSSQSSFGGSSDVKINLKFGNGTKASGLDLRARRESGPSTDYTYRIVYWVI